MFVGEPIVILTLQEFNDLLDIVAGDRDVTKLPECTDKWYTATDIGSVLGISAQKVGRIANKHGLKPLEG